MSSRLRDNTPIIQDPISQQIFDKLDPWIRNPPVYEEVVETLHTYGQLQASIKLLKRKIDSAEDAVTCDIDKPRSNDARIARIKSTASLRDKLAELEADFAIIESKLKLIEIQKTMFNAANFRTRIEQSL